MKYNKKNIMRNAWAIRKTSNVSMSVALKAAWALEKHMPNLHPANDAGVPGAAESITIWRGKCPSIFVANGVANLCSKNVFWGGKYLPCGNTKFALLVRKFRKIRYNTRKTALELFSRAVLM